MKTFLTSTGRDQTIALGEISTSIFERLNNSGFFFVLKGVQKYFAFASAIHL